MKPIKPPVKPFPNYKWRWATFQPTESLNEPPVFLGVLRVFHKFENYAPSSVEVMEALAEVQEQTNTTVNLVRTASRNLVRNSGQYWKALGLLEEAHGEIIVSPFGKLLTTGKITQVEFATTILKTLELPNRRIEQNIEDWEKASLTIKPLELLLDILAKLSEKYGSDETYISRFELVKIIIPLAGAKASLENFADALYQHRKGIINVSGWVDCAPKSNDKRMAREFLLFLANYGFCRVVQVDIGAENERFYLSNISEQEIVELKKLEDIPQDLSQITRKIRETHIPENLERKRVSREILERPYQNVFRKNILLAFNSSCLITGVNMENVLEAAHIVDVKHNGSDKIENGLCLRSDIHQLFDSKHLRLFPDGVVTLSELADSKNNYANLPRKVTIPKFINKELLDWRLKYT